MTAHLACAMRTSPPPSDRHDLPRVPVPQALLFQPLDLAGLGAAAAAAGIKVSKKKLIAVLDAQGIGFAQTSKDRVR